MLKRCFEAASVLVKDIRVLVSDSLDARRIVVDSISRAIWRQDIKLARDLLDHSVLAQELLQIDGRRGMCANPRLFDDAGNQIKFHLHHSSDKRLKAHICGASSSSIRM